MRPVLTILSILLLLNACGGPLYLSGGKFEQDTLPPFHSKKVEKVRLRSIPVSGPVLLDSNHTAWLTAQGEIIVFDHTAEKEIRHYNGKEDIRQFAYRKEAFIWIEARQKNHRLYYEAAANLVYYNVVADDVRWRKRAPGTAVNPVIADSVVVVAGVQGMVRAYSVEDGKEQWETSVNSRIFLQPLVYHNTLIVVDDRGKTRGIDLATGKNLWTVLMQSPVLSAAIDSNLLFLGGFSGEMQCLNLETKNIEWTVQTGAKVRSAPLVDGKTVIWADATGRIYEIDQESGDYSVLINLQTPVVGIPARTEQGYLITGLDGTLYHINFSDGGFLGQLEFQGRLRSTPLYLQGHWYVIMEDDWIYVLD